MAENDLRANNNGWDKWKNLFLEDRKEVRQLLSKIIDDMSDFRIELAKLKEARDIEELTKIVDKLVIVVEKLREDVIVLKTKMTMYAAIGGAASGLVMAILTTVVLNALFPTT